VKTFALATVLVGFLGIASVHAEGQETPHLQFVSIYIQQLGEIEKIRDNAAKDLQAGSRADSYLPDCIRNMTKYQLELSTQIATLSAMHLNHPFEHVVEQITEFYKDKLTLYKQFEAMCSALIAGPKPGVDYGELAATAPKLNAQLEFLDQALFQSVASNFCRAD
jgi:hypothetical protein